MEVFLKEESCFDVKEVEKFPIYRRKVPSANIFLVIRSIRMPLEIVYQHVSFGF